MDYTFETPEPPVLFAEFGNGRLRVAAGDTTITTVSVQGDAEEQVTVTQQGRRIAVVGPKQFGFLGSHGELEVAVTVPGGSELITRLGSADLDATGPLGRVELKSGSGGIEVETINAAAEIGSGSGSVRVGHIGGVAKIATGSGDICLDELTGAAKVSTGSGRIEIGSTASTLVAKSGSGDVWVYEATADVAATSASGDVEVGRFATGRLTAKNASGDIRLGIPRGVPVWTDIASVSGQVRSTLEGAGRPTGDQPYVELRAKTVSGDVLLKQL